MATARARGVLVSVIGFFKTYLVFSEYFTAYISDLAMRHSH